MRSDDGRRGAAVRGLLWLERRHLRTEVAYWGWMAGADIVEDRGVIERLYQAYLVVLLGGCAVAMWWFVLGQVEGLFAAVGPAALPVANAVLFGLFAAPFAWMTLRALRRTPLILTQPDVAFVASGVFPVSAIAAIRVLPAAAKGCACGGVLAFLLGAGLRAAGATVLPGGIAAAWGLLLACAALLSQVAGYVRLSARSRRDAWPCAAVAVFAVGACAGMLLGAVLAPPASMALLGSLVAVLSGATGIAVLLCAALLLWVLVARVARGADMACVIEESGAVAALHGMRRLSVAAPEVYREMRRRYRVARRRPIGALPRARGAAALIARAGLSHVRQYEGTAHLVVIGCVLVPMGALWLMWSEFSWMMLATLVCVFANAYGPVREMSLALREDTRMRALCDMLPCSRFAIALLDGVCAVVIVALPGVVAALLGWGSGWLDAEVLAMAVVLELLLSVSFGLVATFDHLDGGAILTFRVRPSTGMGLVLLALVVGLSALGSPADSVGHLVLFDLACLYVLRRCA